MDQTQNRIKLNSVTAWVRKEILRRRRGPKTGFFINMSYLNLCRGLPKDELSPNESGDSGKKEGETFGM